MTPPIRHVLLTGPPGVGKTTLTQKVCGALQGRGVTLAGFYTEEVRASGVRTGFDVVSIPGGERGPLARVSEKQSGKRSPMVGSYAVDVASFESIALPILNKHQGRVLVVDEVGRMELLSPSFAPALERALSSPGAPVLLATVPSPRGRPLPAVEKLRARTDARTFTVDRGNRNDPTLLEEIVGILTSS